MKFGDEYDIPEEIALAPHSSAFDQFLRNWFVDCRGLIRREVDLSFLRALSPDELASARDLLRRNLALKHTFIIEGVASLHDVGAAPLLREMFDAELNPSLQLTIAGSLWRLTGDNSFIECLGRLKSNECAGFRQAHFHQILWVNDERSIDLMIDLLDDEDSLVRRFSLSELNQLEEDRSMMVSIEMMPHQPDDYRRRREDSAFRALMTKKLREKNAARTNW